MTKFNPPRVTIRQEGEGVTLKIPAGHPANFRVDGRPQVERYSAPHGGGHVLDSDGRRVCRHLKSYGPTLWSSSDRLLRLIREEWRGARAREAVVDRRLVAATGRGERRLETAGGR